MRSFGVGLVGMVLGAVLAVVLVNFVGSRGNTAGTTTPELGGQPVPEQLIEIEFDKRYDVHTSVYGVEPLTLLNCKIMGFTGRKGGTAGGTGSGGFSASIGSSSVRNHFDHWLVLEHADGRLLYLPVDSVKYIEQTAAPAK